MQNSKHLLNPIYFMLYLLTGQPSVAISYVLDWSFSFLILVVRLHDKFE